MQTDNLSYAENPKDYKKKLELINAINLHDTISTQKSVVYV
jgi:hypothetical protein